METLLISEIQKKHKARKILYFHRPSEEEFLGVLTSHESRNKKTKPLKLI